MQCKLCGSPMKERQGKSGKFWGCSAYPQCRGTINIPNEQPTGTKFTPQAAQQPEPKRYNGKSPDERAEIASLAVIKSLIETCRFYNFNEEADVIREKVYSDFVWFRERFRSEG